MASRNFFWIQELIHELFLHPSFGLSVHLAGRFRSQLLSNLPHYVAPCLETSIIRPTAVAVAIEACVSKLETNQRNGTYCTGMAPTSCTRETAIAMAKTEVNAVLILIDDANVRYGMMIDR